MNKDKEKLFSIIAHDIRSPLATLEHVLDMYQDGHLNDMEVRRDFGILHEKVSQLSATLDNMLRWSSRSMQGIQTRPRHFLLLSVLSEVLHFFDLIILQKHITVEIQVPETEALYADRDQVSVILRNIFSNALKFSFQEGSVSIKTTNAGDMVAIHIEDHGVGMDTELLKSLFTSSNQAALDTTGERGFGLGLLLSNEFIRLNKGTIDIKSKLDEGTTVTIILPKGEMPE
ncbi:HAMP domain-containing sensor histidine kinase [Olivibacter ginsenosidimutans]